MTSKNALLFSYGTLRYEAVQLATFGRKLQGLEDILPGYKLSMVKINDESVVQKSGEENHPTAIYTGNPEDKISGIVFEISQAELSHADSYEVSDYKRMQCQLLSGKHSWVYVSV